MAAISNHEGDWSAPLDVLESRDFYEMCYAYRTSPVNPVPEFEALKDWIRQHAVVSVDPHIDDKWESKA